MLEKLIAIGGNYLVDPKRRSETLATQEEKATATERMLHPHLGRSKILTHGNGPQVGYILARSAIASRGPEGLHQIPLDIAVADTQAGIGELLFRAYYNHLLTTQDKTKGVAQPHVPTHTVVDPNDPAFKEFTKPIGPYVTREEAERYTTEYGWTYIEIGERAGKDTCMRRVVASPQPIDILEKELIAEYAERGLVIALGGGGIPIFRNEDGSITPAQAVIDKDRASSLLAQQLEARELWILTDADAAYLDWNKPDKRERIVTATPQQARQYIADGQFPTGSMLPKVQACIDFVVKTGRPARITNLEVLDQALRGEAGTIFY